MCGSVVYLTRTISPIKKKRCTILYLLICNLRNPKQITNLFFLYNSSSFSTYHASLLKQNKDRRALTRKKRKTFRFNQFVHKTHYSKGDIPSDFKSKVKVISLILLFSDAFKRLGIQCQNPPKWPIFSPPKDTLTEHPETQNVVVGNSSRTNIVVGNVVLRTS